MTRFPDRLKGLLEWVDQGSAEKVAANPASAWVKLKYAAKEIRRLEVRNLYLADRRTYWKKKARTKP